MKIFKESREKAIWNILKLPYGVQLEEKSFLHFDVFLDRSESKVFHKTQTLKVMSPFNKPALKEKPTNISNKIPVRIHKIKIKDFDADIYVVVSSPKGIPSQPVIITTHYKN